MNRTLLSIAATYIFWIYSIQGMDLNKMTHPENCPVNVLEPVFNFTSQPIPALNNTLIPSSSISSIQVIKFSVKPIQKALKKKQTISNTKPRKKNKSLSPEILAMCSTLLPASAMTCKMCNKTCTNKRYLDQHTLACLKKSSQDKAADKV